MNATDVLKWGNQTVLRTIQGLPEEEWETPNVCGVWSCKEIIAHLASFEHILVEVLNMFLGGGETPYIIEWMQDPQGFNDHQVGRRQAMSWKEALTEYEETQAETMGLITQMPEDVLRKAGTLPEYGPEYALDDFIVYSFYGHKREHCAQINVFRDTLK